MGLVQRQIEVGGFATISLSAMADLTAATGAPRVAGIVRPWGQLVGPPGAATFQRAVVEETLRALTELGTPGEIRQLPFPYDKKVDEPRRPEPAPSPIVQYLKEHPEHWPLYIDQAIPEQYRV